MNVLISQAKIIYPGHALHRKKRDIHINQGIIQNIDTKISAHKKDLVIESDSLHVSPGWLDINPFVGEPGNEHRETLASLVSAAHRGGYTAIAPAPNTHPACDSKSSIHFLQKMGEQLGLTFFPLGAISQQLLGRELAEILDMRAAGAVGFTDGFTSVKDAGLMMRALQYVKSFDGIVLNHPFDTSLARNGQIHEGSVSTLMGTPGIPSLAEELMLDRDLKLAQYTDSKIHCLNISSKESCDRIDAAQKQGIQASASVPVLNLVYTDEACLEFDALYKVLPPLRASTDRDALVQALQSKIVTAITTNHLPVDPENKDLEFTYASPGIIGLDTSFALLNTHYPKLLELWISCLAIGNRDVLSIPVPALAPKQKAELTLFDPTIQWTYSSMESPSMSRNTPFDKTTFTGKVIGVVLGDQWYTQ